MTDLLEIGRLYRDPMMLSFAAAHYDIHHVYYKPRVYDGRALGLLRNERHVVYPAVIEEWRPKALIYLRIRYADWSIADLCARFEDVESAKPAAHVFICSLCHTSIEKRRVPMGQHKYCIEIEVCACEAKRIERRYNGAGENGH